MWINIKLNGYQGQHLSYCYTDSKEFIIRILLSIIYKMIENEFDPNEVPLFNYNTGFIFQCQLVLKPRKRQDSECWFSKQENSQIWPCALQN